MFVLNFYSPVFIDQLKRGRKTATIRLGDKAAKYRKGEVVLVTVGFQHSPRERIFEAVIDGVEVKPVSELTPRDIEHDNPEFRRLDETVHFLEQIYGRKVEQDDVVTVVRFSQISDRPAEITERLRRDRRRTEARVDRSLARRLVAFAVGLAFADASIVVLALPQIVGQFDTTISRVVWVIMAYNIAVVVGVLAFLPFVNRISARAALLWGLGLFGLASIGCGVAGGMEELVAFRFLQGLGGALLLCASLPVMAATAKPGRPPIAGWAAAAALGAAIGPVAGGVLTQVFDWRAIFLAQAPAAALAAAAVWAAKDVDSEDVELERDTGRARRAAARNGQTRALALLSAGLIGALFLVVILLIDVWKLDPLGAAAVVSVIPIATYAVERAARGRSPLILGAAGAILVAVGLCAIASARPPPARLDGAGPFSLRRGARTGFPDPERRPP